MVVGDRLEHWSCHWQLWHTRVAWSRCWCDWYVTRGPIREPKVRERLCTKDIELLSVSLRPLYLPREFPQIFVMVVYIHPRANVDNASQTILQSTQAISPDAPVLILGNFNHCSLQKTLRDFYQYVKCPTRLNKTLDLCYDSIKGAYKALPLPLLGVADHNCIQLIPSYCTALQRVKPVTKWVKVWTDESILSLQGCYECTDWEIFKESC